MGISHKVYYVNCRKYKQKLYLCFVHFNYFLHINLTTSSLVDLGTGLDQLPLSENSVKAFKLLIPSPIALIFLLEQLISIFEKIVSALKIALYTTVFILPDFLLLIRKYFPW